MAARDHASTRFSPLDLITAENAHELVQAWTFDTGLERGHEAAPIVVGETMYLVTPYPNVVYALDVGKKGAVRWKFEPETSPAAQGVACCDVVNRGGAFADGRFYFNTLDGQTIALDARSGAQLWKTRVGNIHIGETLTMAPLVVKDKVLVGNSGGEFGVRGWLKALDAKSGKIAWTAYSTGPDAEVLIDERFEPFYASDRGKDLGVTSWPPDHWKLGGGTVWGWISYDPALDLVYYGTGNPGMWNASLRPGDNKWACGVFARDPDDGHARWFYQWSPHDLYDHDGVNECVLTDLEVEGERRAVLLHPGRNGYVYVLDRRTGEVLSATPFVRITSAKGVDLATGRPAYVEEKKPRMDAVVRDIAPASPGAKDWQPSAFSPRTGLLYLPHQTLSMDYEETEVNYIAGTPFIGVEAKFYADPAEPGDGSRGAFTAWDPAAKRAAWKIKEKFPVWSGALVTAGDVVFYGTMDRRFRALDARTGEVLREFETASGIVGQPVTYLGPDGRQYVAIFTGIGGWPGSIVSADLDTRDASASSGWGSAMKDLAQHTPKGGRLYVFSLP